MSTKDIVRPIVGQRIVVHTIHPGAEKKFFATALGLSKPLLGVHFLRDSPRSKVLTRWPHWRKPKHKLIYESVTSAVNVTVLKPDPDDPTGQLAVSSRIPHAHLRYFTRVEDRSCSSCGGQEVLRITRYRQTAEVCRACNAVLPKLADRPEEQTEAECVAMLASAVCGFGLPSVYWNFKRKGPA